MKKCSRCGTEILTGQLVCPHCGKPQHGPRKARCRHCGTASAQTLEVCPACGEPLRHDWLRPVVLGSVIVIGVAMGLIGATWLWQIVNSFQPAMAVSTVQAAASEVPVFVEVPTLTPSLTPSVTPTPTNTPTTTPTPSLTPTLTPSNTPTETPSPTPTGTATPTATRPQPSSTPTVPTSTPTPAPTVAPPILLKPEDGALFSGEREHIELAWTSSHTLETDECNLVTLRWTEGGAPASTQVCVQTNSWFVDELLYLRADQATDRAYFWNVALARKETGESGRESFIPFSPPSEERSFHWR